AEKGRKGAPGGAGWGREGGGGWGPAVGAGAGPAAVRGDALRRTPLGSGPGRRRRGSPESEDLPVALHTDPLAEGGIVASLRLALVLTLLLVLPAVATAATVNVRVQGTTRTILS